MNNIMSIGVKDKCVSCGMCYSVCPFYAIEIHYDNKSGFYRPRIQTSKCVNCGKCIKCCPTNDLIDCNSLIGPYISLFLAHSNNERVRFEATSGV